MNLTLKYGLQPCFQVNSGVGNVNSVYQIKDGEFIATTNKDILKFHGNSIKNSANIPFECSTFIEELDLIVAVTLTKHEFIVFSSSDFSKPLLQGVKTNQLTVFHIIYSPFSDVLITIGTGIRVWQTNFGKVRRNTNSSRNSSGLSTPSDNGCEERISITFSTTFLPSFESPLLNTPSFDFNEEKLYLTTEQGISCFTLNGQETAIISKQENISSSSSVTSKALSYQEETKKLIYNENFDICVYNVRNQTFLQRYSLSNESLISSFIADKENVLLVTSQLNVYILNMKTGKFCRCYSFQQPLNRIFYYNKKMIVCSGSMIYVFDIVIPWEIWAQGINRAPYIRRCNKMNEASRIMISSNTNIVHLFNPLKRKQITSYSLTVSNGISDILYDRGGNKDVLFFIENGKIMHINTQNKESQEPMEIKIGSYHAYSINTCKKVNSTEYVVGTTTGDLLFCDYFDFQIKSSLNLSKTQEVVTHIFVSHNQETLIALLTNNNNINEIITIDIQTESIVERKSIHHSISSSIIKFNNDIVFIGETSGLITMYEVTQNKNIKEIIQKSTLVIKHNSQITDISFSLTPIHKKESSIKFASNCKICSNGFWISSSIDGDLMFWDNKTNTCFKIVQFNVPIYACEVLNGFRDILVSTENEIMIIRGSTIFGEEIDPENKVYDTYDKKIDMLMDEEKIVDFHKEDSYEDMNSSKKNKLNKRIESFRSYSDAYKKNESDSLIKFGKKAKDDDDILANKQKILQEMMAFSDGPIKSDVFKDDKITSQNSKDQNDIQNKVEEEEEEYEYISEDEYECNEKSPEKKKSVIVEQSNNEIKQDKDEILIKNQDIPGDGDKHESPNIQNEVQHEEKKEIKVHPPSIPKPNTSPKHALHIPHTSNQQAKISESIQESHDSGIPNSRPIHSPTIPKYNMSTRNHSRSSDSLYKQSFQSDSDAANDSISNGDDVDSLDEPIVQQFPSPNKLVRDQHSHNEVVHLFQSNRIPLNFSYQHNNSEQNIFEKEMIKQNLYHPAKPSRKPPSNPNSPIYNKNKFLYDPDHLASRQLNQSISDSHLFDPKQQPALYRYSFFHKPQGYSMSSKTYKTILLPPILANELTRSARNLPPSKRALNQEFGYLRPARYSTPPIIRRKRLFLTKQVQQEIITTVEQKETHKEKRSKSPETNNRLLPIKKRVIEVEEAELMYGKGNHVLQPLSDDEFDPLENQAEQIPKSIEQNPLIKIRPDLAQQELSPNQQQKRGKLGDSLVIHPIPIIPDGQLPPNSLVSNRGRIVVPVKRQQQMPPPTQSPRK